MPKGSKGQCEWQEAGQDARPHHRRPTARWYVINQADDADMHAMRVVVARLSIAMRRVWPRSSPRHAATQRGSLGAGPTTWLRWAVLRAGPVSGRISVWKSAIDAANACARCYAVHTKQLLGHFPHLRVGG